MAPPPEDTERALQLRKDMVAFYRRVATMLAVWPPVKEALAQGL